MAKFIIEANEGRFNKMLLTSIGTSVLFLVLGIVMLFLPELTNNLLGILVGIVFLVSGANTIFKFFQRDGAKLYSFNLIFGILLSIIGVVIMLSPSAIASALTICLGLYFIVFGSNKVTYGIWFKIGDDSSWLITLVIGIMYIVIGFLIIGNPFSALTLTKLMGIFLIISAVLDLTDVILLKKRAKEVSKIFW